MAEQTRLLCSKPWKIPEGGGKGRFKEKSLKIGLWVLILYHKFLRFQNDLINSCDIPLYQNDSFVLAIFLQYKIIIVLLNKKL